MFDRLSLSLSQIISGIHPPDAVLFSLVAAFFLWGFFRKALLREVFSLLALVAGYFAAVRVGAALGPWEGDLAWLRFAVYAGTFLAVWVVVVVAGKLLFPLARMASLGIASWIGGGLVGIVKGVLIAAAAVAALDAYAPGFLPPAGKSGRLMPFFRGVGGYLRLRAVQDAKGARSQSRRRPARRPASGWARRSLPPGEASVWKTRRRPRI